jgi:hypothetical protein
LALTLPVSEASAKAKTSAKKKRKKAGEDEARVPAPDPADAAPGSAPDAEPVAEVPTEPAAPATGTLAISSLNEGAKIEIDGRTIGTVPLAQPVTLPPGEHTVAITLDGWVPATRTVTVSPGGSEELEVDLIPEPTATQTHRKIHASLLFGAGGSDEPQTPQNSFLSIQASFAYSFIKGLLVGATFRESLYKQTYLSPTQPMSGPGPLSATMVNEQLADARIFVSYDALATVTDLVSLDIGLAPRLLNLSNGVFDIWSIIAEVGGLVTLHPTPKLHISGGAAVGGVLATGEATRSVFGAPKLILDYRAGLAWDFGDSPVWSIELRWQGQSLTFEHTERFSHGAMAGLRFAM